jgi:hypothetical protein
MKKKNEGFKIKFVPNVFPPPICDECKNENLNGSLAFYVATKETPEWTEIVWLCNKHAGRYGMTDSK